MRAGSGKINSPTAHFGCGGDGRRDGHRRGPANLLGGRAGRRSRPRRERQEPPRQVPGGLQPGGATRALLVLRDLDTDADCAPTLARKLLPAPARGMTLRIATRAIESRLLADAPAFARFFSVSVSRIPRDPDSLLRPKTHLVNILRHSRSRTMREDIVPRHNSGATVGPGYTGCLTAFVGTSRRPTETAERSDSLRRCLARLAHRRGA